MECVLYVALAAAKEEDERFITRFVSGLVVLLRFHILVNLVSQPLSLYTLVSSSCLMPSGVSCYLSPLSQLLSIAVPLPSPLSIFSLCLPIFHYLYCLSLSLLHSCRFWYLPNLLSLLSTLFQLGDLPSDLSSDERQRDAETARAGKTELERNNIREANSEKGKGEPE